MALATMHARQTHCWHCAPLQECHRYLSRGKCERCAQDDDERPAVYSPATVRSVLRKMRDWEDLSITRIAAEDVRLAMAALKEAKRLTNLEQNVLSLRLYMGYSEARVAGMVERDGCTVRRAVSSGTRKISVWLASPSHGQGVDKGYRRLLARILESGS